MTAVLHFAVQAHKHLQVHGPPIGYVGIVVGAFISWIGLVGAGEAAVVTGGVFAARHRLDIGAVVAGAWLGAYIGGITGWLLGRRVGTVLETAPGPLLRARRRAARAGERFFARFGALAVFLTPSWVAGINQVRAPMYLLVSAAAALLWALTLGLGTYFIGPEVAEYLDSLGLAGSILVVVGALGAGTYALVRRRRRRRSG
jgi:undecaprenyl-diphosphatase